MGYFSELDHMRYEETEWRDPSKVQQLTDRLNYLKDRLANLEDACPCDMSDPAFDEIFYSDCLTAPYDDVSSIQGVLQAIRKTEEFLRIAEEEECLATEKRQRQAEWRSTVLETGATPDYQIVLLGVFFPVEGRSAAA